MQPKEFWNGVITLTGGALLSLAVLIALLLLSGCAWHGLMGDGCVLCDLAPSPNVSPQRRTLTEPTPVVPATRFDGRAVVALDWSLRNLQGEIFQALRSACGIIPVEAKDRYGWPTAPAHDYGVEIRVFISWQNGISTARVSVMVSRVEFGYQRRDYVFLKNGSGAATYGEWYGAYGARRIGMYRDADSAIRFAATAAIANLCGGTLSYRPHADIETPQEVPASCAPPDCIERTISVYGTWGGYGINSHWPSRPAYTAPEHRRHRHHSGQRRPLPPPRDKVPRR